MIELNVTHAPFRQTPRYEAIIGETGFTRLRPIGCANRVRLFANIHRVSRFHLHAEGHLILGNPRDRFRIPKLGITLLIDLVDCVQHAPAKGPAHFWGIIEIEHRFPVGAALHALINARQKSGSPKLLAAIGRIASREQYDETRQVLIFGAQSIEHPRAECRVAEARIARLH